MKTSNKILLSVLLAAILILTGLHLALYAKIKNSDFVSSGKIPDEMERYSLPVIKNVSITGLVNCQLISYGEQPGIEIHKEGKRRISYKVEGETLVITGDSTATKETYEHGERNNVLVNLRLPATAQIKLAYGSLWLSGGYDSAHAPSYAIELATDAYLGIMHHEPEATNVFFNSLNLVINKSSIELNNKTVIDELHVQSHASHFICQQASIRQMTMNVDSKSTVFMQETNLKSLIERSNP
jgi:hypothetical protein